MIKQLLALVLLASSVSPAFAQRYWTLEECVNTAMKNNISLKQRELTRQSAEADLSQSKLTVLPSLNGQFTNNWNTGFAIDPVTNTTTRDATFRSNNFSVGSSMTIFNGFQNVNNVRLQQSNVKAAGFDLDATRNNIALSVCNAYLQALQSAEIAESRRLQTETTKALVAKQEKLYELGAANKARLLQLKAQLSNEELLVVNAENQLAQAYLTLWQAMNITPDTANKVQKPEKDFQVEDEARNANQVFEAHVQNSPELKGAVQRSYSSELSKSIAQGGISPRLTLSAGINSFYTTQNRIGAGTIIQVPIPIGQDVNGNPVISYTTRYSGTEIVSFSEQFDRNLGKNVGLTLSLPIFNGGQVRTNIQKQRINQVNTELDEQQTRLNVYKNVNQAYLDFKASLKRYESNVNNLDANKEAFSLAEGQFNLGALSTNDYLQSRNSYLQAETDFLQAKYELMFRRKVLDFYLGKPLY